MLEIRVDSRQSNLILISLEIYIKHGLQIYFANMWTKEHNIRCTKEKTYCMWKTKEKT